MLVSRLETSGFRNLTRTDLEIEPGLTLIHGPNGAGKTNLMEAIYFGLTGRSCRTNNAREMIAFGQPLARAEVEVDSGGGRSSFLAAVSPTEGRRYTIDGKPLEGASEARPAVAVFMPDRLALVKGAPALRRSHLDNLVAAIWPQRTENRRRYREALAQRNALLGQIRRSGSGADRLDPWDAELAERALKLIADRGAAVAMVSERFTGWAERLGLPEPTTAEYSPRCRVENADELVAELRERRGSDIDRGHSGYGPHLDELKLQMGGRALRRYGSQGQQRTALLALLFAERDLLLAERGRAPLMLLDDVLSELDPSRREMLAAGLTDGGQALITATEAEHLPGGAGASLVSVQSGTARLAGGQAGQ